jgi:catechol-2,3-dioxygenase
MISMSSITGLGHIGLFCQDLENMRDFYSRFLGLSITDEDMVRGLCFFSADPKSEHHELALARIRDNAQPTQWVQQVSFVVRSLDDLRDYYHRIKAEGLRIDRTVTHGISCSIYFYDPEDNRIELYYKTGYDIRQPFGEAIDLDQPNDALLDFSKSFEATMGPARGAMR